MGSSDDGLCSAGMKDSESVMTAANASKACERSVLGRYHWAIIVEDWYMQR